MKALILGLVFAANAMGATVTLTMDTADGVSGTPFIDGLIVNKGGMTFTFSNPSHTLKYNFPSTIATETFVQDPTIEGNNSAFGVAFSVPVSTVSFGFLVSSQNPVAQMATVALFNNSAVPFATIPLASSVVDSFAEGQFVYNGAQGPVTNILVTPTPSGNFTAMAFDNLTVTPVPVVPGTPAVPAASPLALVIAAIGLAGLTMLLLRKQSA